MILKKNVLTSVFVLVLGLVVSSFTLFNNEVSASDLEWVKQIGITDGGASNFISLDSNNNAYAVGVFEGTATFGAETITSAEGAFFISKYDTNGNLIWVKQAGGTSYDSINFVSLDSNNNLYVIGEFSGTATFGTETITSTGSDIFIAKYDTDGNLEWVKQAGGSISIKSVSVDLNNDVYMTGGFRGTATFSTETITSVNNSSDIFIAKYNTTDGNLEWVKQAGGGVSSENGDYGHSLSLDSNNNVYVTGSFLGEATFDTETITSVGVINFFNTDIFIAKYDTDGNLEWVKQAGGVSADNGYSISLDSDNNVYVTGGFRGTATFSTETITSEGFINIGDIFIAKYDTDGNLEWVKQSRAESDSYANARYSSISLDSDNNVYVTGVFIGTVVFDTETIISLGDPYSNISDIFITKYDTDGNLEWVKQSRADTNGYFQRDNLISLDSNNNVYVTGSFLGEATFDTETIISVGDFDSWVIDIFIVKYDIDGNLVWVKQSKSETVDDFVSIGAISLDSNNNLYMAGSFKGAEVFGANENEVSLTSTANSDAFILKFSSDTTSPTLTTTPATSITKTTSTLTGEVTNNGGEDLSELGFQIGLDTSYIMATGTVEIEEATGTFSYDLTDLDCNTTYHYRAYATNSAGTSYGDDMTFTTSACDVVDDEDDNDTKRHSRVIGSINPSILLSKKSEDILTTNPEIKNPIITPSFSIIYTRLLKQGLRGDDIKQIQSYLTSKGYILGLADGIFGPKTKQAVIAFQKTNKLTPDGLIGKITIAKINELK